LARIERVVVRAHAGLIIIITEAVVKPGGCVLLCNRKVADDGDGAV
jgi:hypothetical protein